MLSVALVRRRLASSVYVTVPRFNLLSLDMPDRFEVAIVDKVVKEQEKITLEFEKESAVTKEEINLENAKADKDILILRAEVRPPCLCACCAACRHASPQHARSPKRTVPSLLRPRRRRRIESCSLVWYV